jgi:hypothetical protein
METEATRASAAQWLYSAVQVPLAAPPNTPL